MEVNNREEEVCEVCKVGKCTDSSAPCSGISCVRCASGMCKECYEYSVRLYGFVGDKNEVLDSKVVSLTCSDWPYNDYYPPSYGCYKASRGCIKCMTETPPKRDKFGHFYPRDDYPQGEGIISRKIRDRLTASQICQATS